MSTTATPTNVLSQRSHEVLLFAREEAMRLHHSHVGSEHLLLALLRDGLGSVTRACADQGVGLQQLRLAVERNCSSLDEPFHNVVGLTPAAQRIVAQATGEANQVRARQLEPEHLALALLSERDTTACALLAALNINLDDLLEQARRTSMSPWHTQPRLRKFCMFLLGGAVSVVFFQLSNRLAPLPASPDSGLQLLGGFALWLLPLYPTLVVHELGHFVAGYMMGFRFYYMHLGPLVISTARHGLRLKLVWQVDGRVQSIPRGDRALRLRRGIFLAGGPVANLACGLVAWAILLRHSPQHPMTTDTFQADVLLAWIVLWSLATAVLNCVPFAWNGYPSDGKQLLSLIRGGTHAARHVALVRIGRDILIGQRLRDIPDDLMQAALAPRDLSGESAAAHLFAYYWALDRGDPAAATDHLEQAQAVRSKVRPRVRCTLTIEAAYLAARHRNDPNTAASWINRLQPSQRATAAGQRAWAAIALAVGNTELAIQLAQRALDAIEKFKRYDTESTESAWLRSLLAEAKAAHQA